MVPGVEYRDAMGGEPGEGSSALPGVGVQVAILHQDRATVEALTARDEDKPWWGGIFVILVAVVLFCVYIVLKTPGLTSSRIFSGLLFVLAVVVGFLSICVFVVYFVTYYRRAGYRESDEDWISVAGRLFGPPESEGGLDGATAFMARNGRAYLLLTHVGFVVASTRPWRDVLALPFTELRDVALVHVDRAHMWTTRLDTVVLTTRDDRRAIFVGIPLGELTRRLRDLGATVEEV